MSADSGDASHTVALLLAAVALLGELVNRWLSPEHARSRDAHIAFDASFRVASLGVSLEMLVSFLIVNRQWGPGLSSGAFLLALFATAGIPVGNLFTVPMRKVGWLVIPPAGVFLWVWLLINTAILAMTVFKH